MINVILHYMSNPIHDAGIFIVILIAWVWFCFINIFTYNCDLDIKTLVLSFLEMILYPMGIILVIGIIDLLSA